MNDLVKAFKIFEQIKLKNLKINDVTYGCLLDACVKNDRIDLALVLVEKMKADNISLNTILYTTLIKGFSKANKLDEALKIFSLMKENTKTYPNIITYNCILDACVKSQNNEKALEIFSEMKRKLQPDLITYSTLVKGFCKKDDVEVAYNLFFEMIAQKILPDEVLVNLIMEACYANQKYDMGIEVFNSMNELRIRASNVTYGILIKVLLNNKKTIISKSLSIPFVFYL
jgi:pentatricopeptide repeat protein